MSWPTKIVRGMFSSWPPDDGKRELTPEEANDRLVRVGGDGICATCGQPMRKHPEETRLDYIHLVRLCDGMLGKT